MVKQVAGHYCLVDSIPYVKDYLDHEHPVGGEYILKVVAKHADRYNLFFGSPDLMKRKISILRDYCNTIGRDANELQFSVVLPCIIGDSEDEVYQSLVRHKRNDKTLEQYL